MGAWIEILVASQDLLGAEVAPVWGRGLKSRIRRDGRRSHRSPPYGGVD